MFRSHDEHVHGTSGIFRHTSSLRRAHRRPRTVAEPAVPNRHERMRQALDDAGVPDPLSDTETLEHADDGVAPPDHSMYALGGPPSHGSLRLDDLLREQAAVTAPSQAPPLAAPVPVQAHTPTLPPATGLPRRTSASTAAAAPGTLTPHVLNSSASPAPARPAEALVSPASANGHTPFPTAAPSASSPLVRGDRSRSRAPSQTLVPPDAANIRTLGGSRSRGESATQAPEDDGISESLRNALSTALDTSRLTPAQAVEKMLPAPPGPEGDESDSDASPWARQWDQPVETLDHQITGFAVASSKRNADFHAIFPDAPEDDYLIEDYGCALVRDILLQGRLYISENHLCFQSNIFGWVTNLVVPFADIVAIEKRMTALVIPNGIHIATLTAKHTFASFLSRDATYDVIVNVWNLSHPSLANGVQEDPNGAQDDSDEEGDETAESRSKARLSKRARLRRKFMQGKKGRQDLSDEDEDEDEGGFTDTSEEEKEKAASDEHPAPKSKKSQKKRAATECEDGKRGEHYPNVVLDTTYPTSVETLYNLLFTTGFGRDFLVNDQGLLDVEVGDWEQMGDEMERSMSYVKPLNASIGPKQTKCLITERMLHADKENYTTTITTTRTPDVPSGGSFAVKTRTCLTWAGGWNTRLCVTCMVEWTGRSFIRSVIDRASIDGQKEYYKALNLQVCKYMKEHANEFKPEGGDSEDEDSAMEEMLEERSQPTPTPVRTATPPTLPGTSIATEGLWAQVGLPLWELTRDAVSSVVEQVQGGSLSTFILGAAVLVLLLLNVWAMRPRGTRSVRPTAAWQDEAVLGQALRKALQQTLYPAAEHMEAASPVVEVRRLNLLLELQERQIQSLKNDLVRLASRIEEIGRA